MEADCLPEDKLRAIERFEDGGAPVRMVGDGINDAPTLKRATAGIAMGGAGSNRAMDAADIAFVRNDTAALPHVIAVSQRMMTIIKLNMTFSTDAQFRRHRARHGRPPWPGGRRARAQRRIGPRHQQLRAPFRFQRKGAPASDRRADGPPASSATEPTQEPQPRTA
ncbi:HAD family hydrolase [Rubneribacter sp.]